MHIRIGHNWISVVAYGKDKFMAETLGARLKRLREQSGLTQEQVAESVFISRQALSLYENDSRQPTSDRVVMFADLFHVSTDYLLGLQENRSIDVTGLTKKESILISELVDEMSDVNEQLKNEKK